MLNRSETVPTSKPVVCEFKVGKNVFLKVFMENWQIPSKSIMKLFLQPCCIVLDTLNFLNNFPFVMRNNIIQCILVVPFKSSNYVPFSNRRKTAKYAKTNFLSESQKFVSQHRLSATKANI